MFPLPGSIGIHLAAPWTEMIAVTMSTQYHVPVQRLVLSRNHCGPGLKGMAGATLAAPLTAGRMGLVGPGAAGAKWESITESCRDLRNDEKLVRPSSWQRNTGKCGLHPDLS